MNSIYPESWLAPRIGKTNYAQKKVFPEESLFPLAQTQHNNISQQFSHVTLHSLNNVDNPIRITNFLERNLSKIVIVFPSNVLQLNQQNQKVVIYAKVSLLPVKKSWYTPRWGFYLSKSRDIRQGEAFTCQLITVCSTALP